MVELVVQYIINGIIVGIVYAVLTVGYSLIYSTTKIFHLAHAGVFAASGMISWFLFTQGLPLWIAIGVTVVLGGILGAAMELGVYRPLRRRGSPVLLIMVASLGLLISIQSILALLFSPNVRFFSITFEPIVVGSIIIPGWQAVAFILAVVSIGVLVYILQHTKMGDDMRAVAGNQLMSRIVGVKIHKTYLVSMFLGSMLAALAGIIISVDNGANPYSGLVQLLTGLVIMILGGVGNIKGIITVSLIFGVLENISLLFVPSDWIASLSYAVMIVLVLIRATPQLLSLERMGGAL